MTPLGRRILLVDDAVAIRNLYQLFLEKAGLSVFTANGATEALRYFHAFEFHAVVIDIHLEDGDGLDLAQHIKRLRPAVKAIAMTGYPQTPELKKSIAEARIDGFHSKVEPIAKLMDYF